MGGRAGAVRPACQGTGALLMSVAAVAHFMLPDSPYAMWVRDELASYLHLPKDGTRVEVIGGEIVVSPGPSVDHNGMVRDIERGPDLIVMDADVLTEARATKPGICCRIRSISSSRSLRDRTLSVTGGRTRSAKLAPNGADTRTRVFLITYLSTVIRRYATSRCTRIRTRALERMSRCKPGASAKPSACRIRSASRFQRSTGTTGTTRH